MNPTDAIRRIVEALEWAKEGESQRQIEDVAGLLKTRVSELDREYVAHWVGELGLEAEWKRACAQAGIAG